MPPAKFAGEKMLQVMFHNVTDQKGRLLISPKRSLTIEWSKLLIYLVFFIQKVMIINLSKLLECR